MSETNLRNITKSGSNFVPTFIDNHVLLDINLNEYRLINNISTPKKLYIYIYNKNNNNCPLHCVSWINSNLQMAINLSCFPKTKNTYIKVETKLFVNQQDMFNLKFKCIA